MRVAFFGGYDPSYARTATLREGLETRGGVVVPIAIRSGGGPLGRAVLLAARWAGAGGALDSVLVPAFGHRDMPLAATLGKIAGTPVIFDPLVSRWDTQVGDLGRVRAGSFAAGRLRASDRISLSLADLVLCDTWEHGDFYTTEYGVPRKRLCRVPVGADRAAFARGEPERAPRDRRVDGPLEIVFVGGFLPLHGVDVVVEAAAILESRRGHDFARFTLVGGGMTAPRTDRDVAARGLRTVRRVGRLPYDAALDAVAGADLALGIFGTTAKAGRVVPHKVFQSLAAGVPTITRRSRAIAEFFREGEHLALVPPGDPAALAAAIEALAADPARRESLGLAGRKAALAEGSPERIGSLLADAVARAREATAPRRSRR